MQKAIAQCVALIALSGGLSFLPASAQAITGDKDKLARALELPERLMSQLRAMPPSQQEAQLDQALRVAYQLEASSQLIAWAEALTQHEEISELPHPEGRGPNIPRYRIAARAKNLVQHWRDQSQAQNWLDSGQIPQAQARPQARLLWLEAASGEQLSLFLRQQAWTTLSPREQRRLRQINESKLNKSLALPEPDSAPPIPHSIDSYAKAAQLAHKAPAQALPRFLLALNQPDSATYAAFGLWRLNHRQAHEHLRAYLAQSDRTLHWQQELWSWMQ